MIVGIVGSRDYADLPGVHRFVHALAVKHPGAIVVSGGARGVDSAAEEAAEAVGLSVISYRPYKFDSIYGYPMFSIETHTTGEDAQAVVVEKHRRINPPCFKNYAGAAFCRNGWIVDDAAQIVAFWDGVSSGTTDTLKRAEVAGVPAHIKSVAA